VRRRITVAMTVMVACAVVLTGAVSLVLNVHASVNQTRRDLVREAQGLAASVRTEASDVNRNDPAKALRTILVALKSPLRLQGESVVAVRPDGVLYDPANPRQAVVLPSGLSSGDLNSATLLAGAAVSGRSGGVVYAAVPYSTQIQVAGVTRNVVLAVILTRAAPGILPSAGLWLVLSAAAIIIAALVVARRLGRRFVRPIEAAESVTRSIAGGDLDARVPDPPGSDPELAQLSDSINSMADALARASGTQRQFLLSVSHDLRTPLTSIRGFAEAIEDGAVSDPRRAAAVIAAEARRLERLVRDLLDLAKLETKGFSFDLREIDLAASTRSTVAGFVPSAHDLDVQLSLSTRPAGPVPVLGDADRLGQVVANLVENALNFARSRVVVAVGDTVDGPVLWVEDDGPGIAGEDLPRVFERLWSSDRRPGRQIGSGLGLAIVAELVEAMGGAVRAESPIDVAGGTRMVVTLPRPSPPGSLRPTPVTESPVLDVAGARPGTASSG
jgi:two-component system sensor histidine kinase BaeS